MEDQKQNLSNVQNYFLTLKVNAFYTQMNQNRKTEITFSHLSTPPQCKVWVVFFVLIQTYQVSTSGASRVGGCGIYQNLENNGLNKNLNSVLWR